MSGKNLILTDINRKLGPTFRAAAGDVLVWGQEKAFFEAQIRKDWKVEDAVRRGIPETIESLTLAARECASMGLSMSPQAQLVYFIPRKARKKWANESDEQYKRVPYLVTATPSYRGLAYIATHYAGASIVAAEVVFKADKFRYFGPIHEPEHEPTLVNSERTEAKAIGAYAVIKMKDGSVRCEYMDEPTIRKIRQKSEMPNSLMWTVFWTEGWRKAPIRRICKTVMVTDPRMGAAIEALNANEGIVFENDDPDPQKRGAGMSGLGEAMKQRQEAIEPQEIPPEPPVDRGYKGLALPAPSDAPPGSIEWWFKQIDGARDPQRMDEIKVAALQDRMDESEDADLFRDRYIKRSKEIKAGAST